MSRCYFCATTKTTCPACTRRALEQAVVDAARQLREDRNNGLDMYDAAVAVCRAVAALDGGGAE